MNLRRLRLGLLTGATALAGVVLVVLFLQAAHRPALRKRIDLTSEQTVGLSARSSEALRGLPEGSRLTAFLFRQEHVALQVFGSSALPRAFARIRSLLEDAHIRAEGRVEVAVLDESSAPIRLQEARERTERQIGEVLVIETPAGRRRKLRLEDLFVFTQPTAQGEPARLLQDRVDSVLGDLALRLGREELPRVGVVAGVVSVPLRDPRGLGLFVEEVLTAQGYEVVPVQGLSEAPGDLDLLVFLGQQREFLPEERSRLESWITGGRPLFLALGSGAPPAVVEQWNALLEPTGLGFEVVPGADHPFLCEPFNGQTGLSACAELTLLPDRMSPQHPVTRPLLSVPNPQPVYAPNARPLRIGGGNDTSREELLGTTTRAWIEVEKVPDFKPTDPDREPQGRQAVVLASERWNAPDPERAGRTILCGSALAWHGQAARINRNLGASAIRWLLAEDEVGVAFVPIERRVFRPTPEARARLGTRFQLVIPGVPFLISLLLIWRRRR